MQTATKLRIWQFVAPLVLGIGYVIKIAYYVTFAWWLDPLLQRKGNRELVEEIKAKVPCLISKASSIQAVQADWPTVKIICGNLLFTIVRWQDDIALSVSPRHVPNESYQLGPLVAAVESRHFSERDIVNDLVDAEKLLGPRIKELNAAFSEQEYPRIRERL